MDEVKLEDLKKEAEKIFKENEIYMLHYNYKAKGVLKVSSLKKIPLIHSLLKKLHPWIKTVPRTCKFCWSLVDVYIVFFERISKKKNTDVKLDDNYYHGVYLTHCKKCGNKTLVHIDADHWTEEGWYTTIDRFSLKDKKTLKC